MDEIEKLQLAHGARVLDGGDAEHDSAGRFLQLAGTTKRFVVDASQSGATMELARFSHGDVIVLRNVPFQSGTITLLLRSFQLISDDAKVEIKGT